MVRLNTAEPLSDAARRFINRLSDLLFILGRVLEPGRWPWRRTVAERQERCLKPGQSPGHPANVESCFASSPPTATGPSAPSSKRGRAPSAPAHRILGEQLRQAGYVVEIESQAGAVKEDNSDLAAALASMA